MLKKLILTLIIFFIFTPVFVFAENIPETETFRAEIIEILEEREIDRENNSKSTQQNIKMLGVDGSFENKEIIYYGISDIDVLSMSNTIYKVGDKVHVNAFKNIDGSEQFFIMNYVRRGHIYLLGILFAIVIILVGKKKGVRSLVSLVISFFVIIKFIIPQIINGHNPLVISLIGSAIILIFIIYLTDGFNRKTHLSIISVLLSLLITFLLSIIFVNLTRLTGFSSEETSFLVGIPGSNIIDFRGLLLAGILIGTLGVLDDAILGQVEAVSQIKKANPDLKNKQVIKSANKIGRSHLGAMVNTLFLTYAGASLPLLILFSLSDVSGLGFGNVIDNEFIATEIVRTLTGSIGLALAFPITTYLATYFLEFKKT
jgi:uncharacterized membrane protein